MTLERIPADQAVAIWAARVPSASRKGLTHDVHVTPEGHWDCTCEAFAWRGGCRHVAVCAEARSREETA